MGVGNRAARAATGANSTAAIRARRPAEGRDLADKQAGIAWVGAFGAGADVSSSVSQKKEKPVPASEHAGDSMMCRVRSPIAWHPLEK